LLATRSLNVESRKAKLVYLRASLCGSYPTVTRSQLKTFTAQVNLINLKIPMRETGRILAQRYGRVKQKIAAVAEIRMEKYKSA